jgi:hypothetical protein
MKLYTNVTAHDIYRLRSLITIPFRDSVATTAPLRMLIQDQINQCLMDEIAAEHKRTSGVGGDTGRVPGGAVRV